MTTRRLLLLAAAALWLGTAADRSTAQRFQPLDVVIDSGDQPLAAYQLEVTVDGEAMIVGVEGGDSPAFAAPPHYDPKALTGGRIVLADLDVGRDLPRGRVRVATLHMRESGAPPAYHVVLQAAANADGTPIPATVRLEPLEGDRA